jgi:hypothetical protein
MRRRRWLWIGVAILCVAVAALAAWPRDEEYAYLRPLHPRQDSLVIEEQSTTVGDSIPKYTSTRSAPGLVLQFPVPIENVRRVLLTHGALVKKNMGDSSFILSNGKEATLQTDSPGATLVIFNTPLTWQERTVQWIKGMLHL